MQGVVFLGDRELEVREFAAPKPGPGEVVVRMEASGLCGSDLKLPKFPMYRASKAEIYKRKGLIPGHEPSGLIHEIGEGVENVKPGDRVMVYHAAGCGNCASCRSGEMFFCNESWILGERRDGADADFLLVPSVAALKLPDELSFIDGAIMACAGVPLMRANLTSGFQRAIQLLYSGLGL